MVSLVGVSSYRVKFQSVALVFICKESSILEVLSKKRVSVKPFATAAIFTACFKLSCSIWSYKSIMILGVSDSSPAQISSFSQAKKPKIHKETNQIFFIRWIIYGKNTKSFLKKSSFTLLFYILSLF